MHISAAEQAAIRQVIDLGHQFGFGNLIAHLETAWAKSLMRDGAVGEEIALAQAACHRSGYPFAMQEDLLERGEWDETGARYR